jgi:hypothetical protein
MISALKWKGMFQKMSLVGRVLARGVAVSALVLAIAALPANAQAAKPKPKKATKKAAAAPAATTDALSQMSDTGKINWSSYQNAVKEAPRDTITPSAYTGWKQYELNCSRCHGEFGVGSSFAPALIVSLRDGGTIPDQAAFVQTVCAGRKEKGMPSWCEAGLEMDKILSIYDYMKGRADGKIHQGRPAVKAEGR